MSRKPNTISDILYRIDTSDGPDACHPWTRGRTSQGYGEMSIGNKMYKAPRLVWEYYNGPIPKGLDVLHSCDNPPCCNKRHLFLGTDQDNMDDKMQKGRGRWVSGKDHGSVVHPEKFVGNGGVVHLFGENNGAAILTEPLVRKIKFDRKAGMQLRELEEKYELSKSTIISAVYKWRHITL